MTQVQTNISIKEEDPALEMPPDCNSALETSPNLNSALETSPDPNPALEPLQALNGNPSGSASGSPAHLQTTDPAPPTAPTDSNTTPTPTDSATLQFSSYSYLQDAMQKFLKDNGRKVGFTAFLFLYPFQICFGAIADATFLFWLLIIMILTKLNHMSARHEITCKTDSLQITRKHWLGKEVLNIPLNQLETLEFSDTPDYYSFRIRTKENAISRLNKVIFQDIFDYDNSILIRDKQGADGKQAFLEYLEKSCPAEKLTKTIETLEAPQETAVAKLPFMGETNYELVEYSSLNYFQQKLSRFLKSSEQRLMFPLFISVAALLFFAGTKDLIGGLVTSVFVPLLLFNMLTHERRLSLFFTTDGIRLLYNPDGATQASKVIPWSAVEYVNKATDFSKAKDSPERQRIEFCIKDLAPEVKHLKLLSRLSMNLFRKRNGKTYLSLDLNSVQQNKDRQSLLAAISRFVPDDRVDASVKEALNPTDPASYTKLWLDSLATDASDRRFEGKLGVGQQLRNGNYEILEFLGAGGQASVYLADSTSGVRTNSETVESHSQTAASDSETAESNSEPSESKTESKKVVLKEFILPSHAGADRSVRSLAHIEKELQLMKELQHPNIVEYYDIFVEDHRCYLVLEHVEGKSLRALVEESGPLSEKQVLNLAQQMSTILQHLHQQKIPVVHRDFTPENLILDKNGVLKVIDFNLAQQLEEASTRTIVGKHSYLPPEQFRGKACPQSDIYAMGATLYFLLTGQEPEPLSCSHPLELNPSLSAEIDALVASATELELADRFKDADAIEQKLKEIL